MSGHSLGTIEFGSGTTAGYGTDQHHIGTNSMFEDFDRDVEGRPIGLGNLTPDVIRGINERAVARRIIAGSWINPDYPDLIERQQVVQAQAEPFVEEPPTEAIDPRAHITDAYTPQAQGLGKVTVAELAGQVRETWSVVQGHVDKMAAQRARRQELGISPVGRVASRHRLINPPRNQGYDSWGGFLTDTPTPEPDMQDTMPFHPFLDPDIVPAGESLRRARKEIDADTLEFFYLALEQDDNSRFDVQAAQPQPEPEPQPEAPVIGSPIMVSVAPGTRLIGVPPELVDASWAVTIPMQRIESDPRTGPHDLRAEFTTDSLPVIRHETGYHPATDSRAPGQKVEVAAEAFPEQPDIIEAFPEEPEKKLGFLARWKKRLFGGRRAAKTVLHNAVEIEELPADTTYEGSGRPVQGIDPDTIITKPIDVPAAYIGQDGMQFGGNETVLPLLGEAGQALEDEGNNRS